MGLDAERFNNLNQTCHTQGFARKGNAFFRAKGDGVLQVLKVSKVRNFAAYELRIGLFSLYGEMEPQWFTSRGCIPRYTISIFAGKRSAFYFEEINETYHGKIISFEEQFSILNRDVLPFLNAMRTQAELADGIVSLDTMTYKKPIWNDDLKWPAYLASGNYPFAQQVIQAILDQHADALKANERTMKPDDLKKSYAWVHEMDIPLLHMQKAIKDGNESEIKAYLQKNWERNHKLSKFAQRGKH